MEENLYLCGEDGIAVLSSGGGQRSSTPLCGACALCVGREQLYCAEAGGTIWRFDKQTLMPLGIGSGGPGICAMCLSGDFQRLYALLGEADCVLMMDACSGRPLAVNRCGCNPQSLALRGEILYAAGGESGCIHLFDAHTLEHRSCISLPGPVCSALLWEETCYALCLTAQMDAMFVAERGNERLALRLEGMPGCVSAFRDHVYVCTQSGVYIFERKRMGLVGLCEAPGSAKKMWIGEGRMMALDPLSECLYHCGKQNTWAIVHAGVKDAAVQEIKHAPC